MLTTPQRPKQDALEARRIKVEDRLATETEQRAQSFAKLKVSGLEWNSRSKAPAHVFVATPGQLATSTCGTGGRFRGACHQLLHASADTGP